MSHSCNNECHDHDHDHDHDGPDRGFEFSLYTKIDTERVICLNESVPGSCQRIFKPWDQRFDTAVYTESDADEQLLFIIPFTGSAKIKSISIMGGPGEQSPANFQAFVNLDSLDFDTVEQTSPTQEWEMVREIPRDQVVEYPTKIPLFTNVRTLALFIKSNFGADTTVVYYIGLKGEFSNINKNPIITTYEAAARPTDHKLENSESVSFSKMVD